MQPGVNVFSTLRLSPGANAIHLKTGLSGSVIWLVEEPDGDKFVVKVGNANVIAAEAAHYQTLAPLLGSNLASLFSSGDGYLVRQYVPGDTWHRHVRNGFVGDESLAQADRLMAGLKNLWLASAEKPAEPVYHRVIPKLGPEALPEHMLRAYTRWTDGVRGTCLNEEPVATIVQASEIMRRMFDTPLLYRCLTHGDVKGDNIINGRLIDPRPGYHDWAYDLSFLARWRSSLTFSSLEASIRRSGDWIALQSSVTYPPACHLLEQRAWELGEEVGAALSDPTWRHRTRVYMGCTCFGELRLLDKRMGLGLLAPEPRETYEAYLLGEGLWHFARAQECL